MCTKITCTHRHTLGCGRSIWACRCLCRGRRSGSGLPADNPGYMWSVPLFPQQNQTPDVLSVLHWPLLLDQGTVGLEGHQSQEEKERVYSINQIIKPVNDESTNQSEPLNTSMCSKDKHNSAHFSHRWAGCCSRRDPTGKWWCQSPQCHNQADIDRLTHCLSPETGGRSCSSQTQFAEGQDMCHLVPPLQGMKGSGITVSYGTKDTEKGQPLWHVPL